MIIMSDDIKEILNSKILVLIKEASSKRERITAKEIARILDINRGPSSVRIRARITDLINQGHPIDATSTGYMYISSKKQLDKYIDNLQGRIQGIEDRMQKVTSNYYYIWTKGRKNNE